MSTLVAVTGGTGFVGRAVVQQFAVRGLKVRASVRNNTSASEFLNSDAAYITVGDIGSHTSWLDSLGGVSCVIHCAARTHVMNETEANALAAYRAVNTAGTRRLAEQAAIAGVKRLVFLSSVKVNGESTSGAPNPFGVHTDGVERDDEQWFGPFDTHAPEDPYGISKWEAEQALWQISKQTGLEVVVVRPPLVYGAGVKGNFLRLLHLIKQGLPLPLGAVKNLRSFIGLDNLVDLLIRCVDHPAAPGQTFLVSDGQDISTPDLIRTLARMMNKPARLWPVPVPLLRVAGSLTGKRKEVDRLVGSLRIDSKHTQDILGWSPPVSLEAGLQKMVDWYLAEHGR
jgi:nucleoside-diphosphate-sugar epimerase